MKNFKTIKVSIEESVCRIILNRPEVRNAFNEKVIEELTEVYSEFENNDSVRIIILSGSGKSFCAGADLNWMSEIINYDFQKNLNESNRLADCLFRIYNSSKITVTIVHGAAIGGANGLIAASDFAISANDTVFSLSEVKIGLIPSCIGPYVIKRIGEYNSKEFMLSGERFDGHKAKEIGLINFAVNENELENFTNEFIYKLLRNGPVAQQLCKKMIFDVCNNLSLDEAKSYTAKMIAEIRVSAEGQEGMKAFLEKRKPVWINEK